MHFVVHLESLAVLKSLTAEEASLTLKISLTQSN